MNPLALLLADSRFPSGSYAHSLGLEQAVASGLTDVPSFMAARLRLVAEADARFAVEARRAAASGIPVVHRGLSPVSKSDPRARGSGLPGSAPALTRLDAEWAARCPSPVLREAARRLGAQLLRSAATVWPGDPIAADDGPLPSPAAVAIELSAPLHLQRRERLFAS
jgi:urease accessory protein